MIDDRSFEALLKDALGRAGEPAPAPVDVADRVMARLVAMGPVPRRELGFRQLARWAAAAALFGALLVTAAASRGATFGAALSAVEQALTGVTVAALKLAPTVTSLAATLGRVGMAMIASIQTVLRPLAPLQILFHALLPAVVAAMLGITAIVVGRDIRARGAKQEPA